jgi:fused signal recognition particle receptor
MVSLFGSDNTEKKPGLLDRLKQAVASTKAQLVERLEGIIEGKATLDESVLGDLEATLITADVGVKTAQEILDHLKQQIRQGYLRQTAELRPAVEREILAIL